MKLDGYEIGRGARPWIAADIGAAHNGSLDRYMQLIYTAKFCGADAVKFQCFTPDGDTIACDKPDFIIKEGPWKGRRLYDLYKESHTPREWFPRIFDYARKIGITAFSTADTVADVDFLKAMGNPIIKISSFEIVDTPLIAHAARTGKPMIISTGMASDEEIAGAFDAVMSMACEFSIFLHCISEYPASLDAMNLHRIKSMQHDYCTHVGLSDHTIGSEAAVIATALGACVIEKHLTLSRSDGGPDDGFASEPREFKAMVEAIHNAHRALGDGHQPKTAGTHKPLRPSLYAVQDIEEGEAFTSENVRSIRPGYGLPPSLIDQVLGKTAACGISRGTAMKMEFVS